MLIATVASLNASHLCLGCINLLGGFVKLCLACLKALLRLSSGGCHALLTGSFKRGIYLADLVCLCLHVSNARAHTKSTAWPCMAPVSAKQNACSVTNCVTCKFAELDSFL